MKKSLSLFLAVCMLLVVCLSSTAFALPTAYSDSNIDDGVNIAIQGGKSIELVGTVQPTIISVTMPAYIPFDMNYSLSTVNKVISPAIDVTNHSTVPVDISVGKTSVDLSKMPNASWSDNGNSILSDQIAVGLVESRTQPQDFSGAKWLKNGTNNTPLLTNLAANAVGRLYIVGNIGSEAGSTGTFTVTPTLIVALA